MTQNLYPHERKAPLNSAAHVIEIATLAADRLNALDELVDRFTENMRKLSSDANLAAQKAVEVATRHAEQPNMRPRWLPMDTAPQRGEVLVWDASRGRADVCVWGGVRWESNRVYDREGLPDTINAAGWLPIPEFKAVQ